MSKTKWAGLSDPQGTLNHSKVTDTLGNPKIPSPSKSRSSMPSLNMSPQPKVGFSYPHLFKDLLGFLYMCFASISFKGPGAKSTEASNKKEKCRTP